MKKRFKKQKDLIRAAIKDIGCRDSDVLTTEELHAKNILILSGIRNPSIELVRTALKNANEKTDDIIDNNYYD